MWWLSVAAAQSCPTIVETRTAYRPSEGELAVAGDPGGWPKQQLAQLTPSARAKVEQYKRAFKRYPVDVQERLLAGDLPDGLDEVAAVLAHGEPGYVWESGRGCIGMLYGLLPDDPAGAVAFEACDGSLQTRVDLLRPIPCSRIAAGKERWDKKSRRLEEYTFEQQLDVLAGVRADWMDQQALELAFGRNGTAAVGMEPVQVAAAPRPIVLDRPDPEPEPRRRRDEKPAPAPAPVGPPAGARVDTLVEASIPPGAWTFAAVCGATDYRIEVEVGDGFVARASARDATGGLLHHTTRGVAAAGDEGAQLTGLGVLRLEPPSLLLGPWPIASCAGVEAPAR
jgi:hypothetical protein